MKKKMKTNQDGGSVTASDSAAAGKQLMADQEGAAKKSTSKKGPAKYKKGPAQKKPDANKNGVPDYAEDGVGASKMGYAQKFGAGRMNGYDAGAKKVMDVMTHGGASKYMAEGPGQQKGEYDRKGRGVFISGDEAMAGNQPAYTHSAAVDGNLTQSQIEKQGPCGGPGQRPCGTNELSQAERSVVNDGDMNNYLSRQVSDTPRGRGFQARMDTRLTQNRARQRSADSSYVVSRGNRQLLSFKRDFDNNSQGGRPGGRQKGNVVGKYNPIDPNTGRITDNQQALDPNTGSMTMTKSKVNKPRKKA